MGPKRRQPITEKTSEMEAEYRVVTRKDLSASFNSLPFLTAFNDSSPASSANWMMFILDVESDRPRLSTA